MDNDDLIAACIVFVLVLVIYISGCAGYNAITGGGWLP